MTDSAAISDLAFGAPRLIWLVALAPAAAAAAALLWRRRLRASAAWAARGLWSRLLPSYARRRLLVSVLLLTLAVAGTALALARPRWGRAEQEVERRGADVVFILDSSLSMGAMDLAPDRLFVGETLVRRLVEALPRNRVALVQMEGTAEVLSPLTHDTSVIELLLDTVEPGSLDRPGTLLEPALATATELFLPGGDTHRVVVLASDGEHHGGDLSAITQRLVQAGVVVHTLGVGTLDGAPVPVPGPTEGQFSYKMDGHGDTVVSRLGEGLLETLARSTGGVYLRVSGPMADLEPVLRRIRELEGGSVGRERVELQKERFQWPLTVAMFALLAHLAFGAFQPRKIRASDLRSGPGASPRPGHPEHRTGRPRTSRARALAIPLALATLVASGQELGREPPTPPPASPETASGTWAGRLERLLHNPRERTETALEAYEAHRYPEALDLSREARDLASDVPVTAFNAGTAELAAGLSREAIATLEETVETLRIEGAGEGPHRLPETRFREPRLAASTLYNLGNARFADGDPAGAVRAYEDALRLAPDHEASKFNLELALRELEKQTPPPPQQSPQEGQGEGEGGQPPDSRQGPEKGQDNEQEGRQGQEPEESRTEAQQPRSSELQSFRDQPDMTAEEAAAILEAVENLERQQRREEAARRARSTSRGDKDW
jgi:Ca-activated chloride channel family protein